MVASFMAMASPCELIVQTGDAALARRLGELVAAEAWRIEDKYSRYRSDSMIGRINASAGTPLEVDEETARLLDFAAQCHTLSDGLFDITSGVLRRVWRFDGSDRVPEAAAVTAVCQLVGFDKLEWRAPWLSLRPGMEIDFGGIGKEYAADRALALAAATTDVAMLVNFGGDLCCNRAPAGSLWQVGVERPGSDREASLILELASGALATSGDTRRYLLREGRRYAHILDPRSGWPVSGGPRSVTVAAPRCIDAGMIATFALLRGSGAEEFLHSQGVQHWCLW